MEFRLLTFLTLIALTLGDDDLKSEETHLAHAPLLHPRVAPHGAPLPHTALPHGPTPVPHVSPYTPAPYIPTAYPIKVPYSPSYAYAPYYNLPKESSVHRNPYESHNVDDAIRTQDADLAPNNPYNNPYLAPHAAKHAPPAHGYGPGLLGHRAVPHAALPHPGPHAPPHPGPHSGPHGGYHPYQYDISKIPECAYTNKHYYNLTFCLQDDYYPTETIQYELERNKPLVDRLLSDITYQSANNLVDGLTKAEEEGYTYEHYYGNTPHQDYGLDYNGYSYSEEYYKKGGYICPSDIFYGRPKRAINTYGKWKVIVNLPDEYYAKGYGKGYEKYTQTQRLEQCMYPSAPCSYIDHKYYSQCLQKHNFVRLLAYTYEEGLHIDSFKMPIACSCHVSQPRHYGHGYGGHPVTPSYGYQGYPAPPHAVAPLPHAG